MARTDAILAAVQRIHEAALAPDGWARAVSAITVAVESQQALLTFVDRQSGAADVTATPDTQAEQLSGFIAASKADAFPRWSHDMPIGLVIKSSQMQADRDFARSEFYNEAIRPLSAFYGLAAAPLRTQRRQVFVTAGRLLGRDDFSMEDVAALQALMPHFTTALHVSERLAAATLRAAGADAALDRLGVGVILVDAAATILFANRMADMLFDDGPLRLDGGCIDTADAAAARELRRLIAQCAQTDAACPGASISCRRADGGASLQMLVAPLRWRSAGLNGGWIGASAPAAILLISDPERDREARKQRLCQRFGLTSAEAAVALEIAKGGGRQAAADRLGVTLATARTHLQHIFEKTNVRRQAELVSLILRADSDTLQ